MLKIHVANCNSTNSLIKQHLTKNINEIVVLTSEEQNMGRGQYARKWVSEKGGLYYSIGFEASKIFYKRNNNITFFIAQIIKQCLYKSCYQIVNIEWPNDIILNGKKLAGILTEYIKINNKYYLVIGIGININQNVFPSYLKFSATSIYIESNQKYSIQMIESCITKNICNWYYEFVSKQKVD